MNQTCAADEAPDDSFEQQFFTLLTRICRQLFLHAEQIKTAGMLSPPQLWFLKRLYDAGAPSRSASSLMASSRICPTPRR